MIDVAALLAKHGPVATGLIIGTCAKFGRMLSVGEPILARQVVGHMMMMGMVGVVATYATDMAGIESANARTFAAAVFAIAASDVIQYLATRAWQRFFVAQQQEVRGELIKTRGELRQNLQIGESAKHVMEDRNERGS